ncbi:MAG: DUF3368 domain-containing protein [Euryarchaeota archaeon]|nr:DUF3368 domain-containing protein [Euryarchaeota archaeon]
MTVVSDSTPLIHLAKVGRLEILFALYGEVLITREVYREVVEEGLLLNREDARVVRRYVGNGIRVAATGSSPDHLVQKYQIHIGEAESIQLAKDIGAELLIINESQGRKAAKSEGLKVKGTIGVVFDALRAGIIGKNEALKILRDFRENPQAFWIDPDIIEVAMRKISRK